MDEEVFNTELSEEDKSLIIALRKVKKKKRIRLILIITAITAAVSAAGIYIVMNPSQKMYIKENEVIYELGEKVSIDPKEYLDQDKTDEEAFSKAKLTSSIINNENYTILDDNYIISSNSEYLNVGEYTFTLSYLNEEENVTIIVQDTTKPVFELFTKKIEVEEGSTINWSDYFSANDLTEVDIKIDESSLDLNKVGEYKITVVASDESNNSISGEAKVVVNKKPEPVIESTPEPAKPQNNSSQTNGNSSNNNQATTPSYTPPQVQQPAEQSHGSEYFMFDSGYDFDSAYSACVSSMNSHGAGACTPLTDAEGIYIGYILNY